ncbi:MAG: BMP family ABC transporter substrate-binding protein [Oscillospiraceae bacterium]|nr:BMP family ABC transporter substrate-binding protein [Oscillospiraceae bacterium]
MKKLIALALALVMLLALGACGSKTPASETDVPENVTPSDGGEPVETALKIAVVTSPSGVDDGSFNQNVYEGAMAFAAEHEGVSVTPIQESDINNSVNAVADIVADYDVIVTPGFQFGGITTLAQENPDKKFILIDAWPVGEDGMDLPEDQPVDNIYAVYYAEQESGFFAGVAAAMETKTGKVAVVNGIAYPSNVNYQYGFEAGVAYANAKLGTSAECVEIDAYADTDVLGNDVGGNYIGDFNDPATGKVVGSALIEQGVDILFVAAGDSGNGVFTAAKEASGVRVIGCDVDQYDDGVNGDSNIVLTSGLKNMALTVYNALNAVVDGSFTGANVRLNATTDGTGFVSEEGRHQLSEETLAACTEAFEAIKAGTIVPPYFMSETTVENFVGLE